MKTILNVNDFMEIIGVKSNPDTRRVFNCMLEFLYSLKPDTILQGDIVTLHKIGASFCMLKADNGVLSDELFNYLKIDGEIVMNTDVKYGNSKVGNNDD